MKPYKKNVVCAKDIILSTAQAVTCSNKGKLQIF